MSVQKLKIVVYVLKMFNIDLLCSLVFGLDHEKYNIWPELKSFLFLNVLRKDETIDPPR